MLSHCSVPELEDHDTRECRCPTTPNWESFQLLQPLLCPAHKDTPLFTRLAKTRRLIVGRSVEIVKEVFYPDWTEVPRNVCNDTVNTELSLMHNMSGAISSLSPYLQALSSTPKFQPQLSTAEVENWLSFARDVVLNTDGASLHHLARNNDFTKGPRCGGLPKPGNPHTPFIHLLLRFHIFHQRFSRAQRERQVRLLLRQWLQILKDGGVNLSKYGRMENVILHDERLSTARGVSVCQPTARAYSRFGTSYSKGHAQVWYLIGFEFGPNLEDWNIWWNEPTDKFAGDFWNLIENPPQRVPGEWHEIMNTIDESLW